MVGGGYAEAGDRSSDLAAQSLLARAKQDDRLPCSSSSDLVDVRPSSDDCLSLRLFARRLEKLKRSC